MEFVASLSQGRTAAAQCGLFTHKSVPVILEPPCIYTNTLYLFPSVILNSERYKLSSFLLSSNKTLIPNYNRQDATFLDLFISTVTLHVSNGSFAHHQKHVTVHTSSGIVNLC